MLQDCGFPCRRHLENSGCSFVEISVFSVLTNILSLPTTIDHTLFK